MFSKTFAAAALIGLGASQAIADCTEARQVWADVKGSASEAVFQGFLDAYGDCAIYAGLAQERLKALGQGEATAAPLLGETEEETSSQDLQLGESTSSEDDTPSLIDIFRQEQNEAEDSGVEGYSAAALACMKHGAAPLHVDGFDGLQWRDIDVEAGLAACRPLQDEDDPNPEALAAYGRIQSKAENYQNALFLSSLAAQMGSGLGLNTLGVLYENGNGVEVDLDIARSMYEDAIEAGSVFSMTNLGDMYRDGVSVDVDGQRALRLYRMAADHGHSTGARRAAWLHKKGDVIERDIYAAVELFFEAFQLGDFESGASIAYIFEIGEYGYPQDEELAVNLYRKAMTYEVFDWAAYRLGMMYLEGRGTPEDEVNAAVYLTLAAEEEHKISQRELGKLMLSWSDLDTAKEWLTRAADNGDTEAHNILDRYF